MFQDVEFDGIWAVDAQLSTDFSKFFSGGVWYQLGRSINYYSLPPSLGSVDNINIWGTLKPVPQLSIGLDVERYWLRDDADREVYDVTVLQSKISYQLTKYLSLRSIIQYESSDKTIGVYPLISFEPTSFTLFYLGSNHDFSDLGEPHGMKETNRQIFVKFQYVFKY